MLVLSPLPQLAPDIRLMLVQVELWRLSPAAQV